MKITFKIAETNNEKKEIIDFFFKHKEKTINKERIIGIF